MITAIKTNPSTTTLHVFSCSRIFPSMDGIKQAAQVHYKNSSRKERARLNKKFDSMDEDKDGKISKGEFLKLVDDQDMPTCEKKWLFAEIDGDRSGSIEFHEFITYFYVINYKPFCDCCKRLLVDTYYCCFRCREKHSNGRKLFKVCEECYSRKLYEHEHGHAEFKDNHVLFQANETSGQGSIRNRFKSILKGEQGSKRQRSRKAVKSAAKFLIRAVAPAAVPAALAAVV